MLGVLGCNRCVWGGENTPAAQCKVKDLSGEGKGGTMEFQVSFKEKY